MTNIPVKDKVVLSLWAIVWFLLILFCLVSLPIILAASFWFFIACIALGFILAIPIYFVLKHALKNKGVVFGIKSYLKLGLGLVLATVSLLAFPVFYFAYITEADPLVLPQVTLTNENADDNKTVVFQGMVHVGGESFYKSVVYDLESALTDGYHLFYEGVQPGDKASDKWFSDTMSGGGELSDRYFAMADVCGIKFQLNYFIPLAKQQQLHPESHITADVTTRELLDEWNRIVKDNPELEKQRQEKLTEDSDFDIILWLQEQSDQRKKIAGILCRALLTKTLAKAKEDDLTSPIILDFRNERLAKQISEHPHNKIYITYGAAHLPGLIKELKKIDEAWRVKSIKWVRALMLEQEYEGNKEIYIPE